MHYSNSRAHLVRTATLAVLCSCATERPTTEPWEGVLSKGTYAVGFRTETLTRSTAASGTRELTLSMWYPAVPDTGRPATVGDLFDTILEEDQLEETDGLSRANGFTAAMTGDAEALTSEAAERALGLPTLSRIDADAGTGSFPLAIWSSRHATVLAQAPLSEILASQGTVVATVWSSDPPLAFLWEDRPESEKLETIEVQTDDLQHALSLLREREEVDRARTVVLAWSYGGQTAARLQERDDGILGVLGLDANVVPARPEERLDLRVPLVWLLGRDSSDRGLESAKDLKAPNLVIALPELAHGNFNALEGFLPGLYRAEPVFPWSMGGPTAVDGYTALVRIGVLTVSALADEHTPGTALSDLWIDVSRAAGNVPVNLLQQNPAP